MDKIEKALRTVGRHRPCEHANHDTRLGDGVTWAKCEDCGATFERTYQARRKKSVDDFDDAIETLRAEVQRLTEERDARPPLSTLPTELVAGEWIMSGQAEPDAVVTYACEPSPETGHVGWCWWAQGKMGDARDYMAARNAAERALRSHAKGVKS